METFTHKEHLEYKDIFSKHWKAIDEEIDMWRKICNINATDIMGVAEEDCAYHVGKEHDRVFRTLLDNKSDTVKFINKALNIKLKEDDIEKYNSNFVNKIFQNQEADIVYKMKNRGIFFLIEQQTKIDYSMPYRILGYQMAIIRSAIDESKLKNKPYKIPLVIPIVLYTGKRKWNANKFLEDSQERLEGVDIKISNYKIIDVNDYTEKELLDEDTLISKVMLLEKAKNSEEMENYLKKIIPKLTNQDKEVMTRIVTIILSDKLDKVKMEEIIKELKGDDEKVLAVMEMLEKESQRRFNMGRKERDNGTEK